MLSTDPIDIKLDSNGDLVIPVEFVRGLDAVIQRIRMRLQMFLGEWFLDKSKGVPHYEEILGQRFNDQQVRAPIREQIVTTPGVVELVSLEISFDAQTRVLSVTFIARTEFGDAESVTLEIS